MQPRVGAAQSNSPTVCHRAPAKMIERPRLRRRPTVDLAAAAKQEPNAKTIAQTALGTAAIAAAAAVDTDQTDGLLVRVQIGAEPAGP